MRLEDIALFEHAIDKGGFPVVNMGNNGDIANIVARGHLHLVLHWGFWLGHWSSNVGAGKTKGAMQLLICAAPFMVAARDNSTRHFALRFV